jgi:CHAT domain-containing protein
VPGFCRYAVETNLRPRENSEGKPMQSFLRFHFPCFLNRSFIKHAPVSILFVLLISPSCVEKKMTLQEAKQVTVSMEGKSFVPPPRRVDDILNVLDQKGQFDPNVAEELKEKASIQHPDTDEPSTLALFYQIRGYSARDLGLWNQYLKDHRKALAYYENAKRHGRKALDDKNYAKLLLSLSIAEANVGNFEKAIALMKQSIAVDAYNPAAKHRVLANNYLWAGNLKAGEEIAEIGIDICNRKIINPRLSDYLTEVYKREKATFQSELLEIRGKYKEAEPHRRVALKLFDKHFRVENRKGYFIFKRKLAMNLANQGRLVEAEIELREVLKEAVGMSGKTSIETARTLLNFGRVLRRQGRLEDAEKMLLAGINNIEASGVSHGSFGYCWTKRDLANIYVSKGDFVQAMNQYDIITDLLVEHENQSVLNRFEQNPDRVIALLKTGRLKEADKLINKNLVRYREYLGDKDHLTASMLGLRGMACSLMGNDEEAMKAFSSSIPILLKRKTSLSDYVESQRLKIIVEAYLNLLVRVHNMSQEKKFHIDASAEIFKLCASLNQSIVRNALGASGARAAAGNEQLADLVRKEQDASKQIEAFNEMQSNALIAPPDQQNKESLAELGFRINSLSTARATILDEIELCFPKYADFSNPKTPDFRTIQAKLNPKEAMIVLYAAEDKSYVWAIPKKGDTVFSVVPIGRKDVKDKADRLRQTLAPVPETLGRIPAFDFDLAYELYALLLKPVEAVWKDAEHLIIVASGPLGQIPFSVFPTSPFKPGLEEELLFENYRRAPWLVKKVALTRLPSVSSLITLRSLPEAQKSRRAFLGFGDPYFSIEQMKQQTASDEDPGRRTPSNLISQRGVRSLVATGMGSLDNEEITSSHIGMLSRLPDTAEEITGIAEALEADLTQDIFLREKATERQVKRMDMSDRKVIAFATHGLIPGDLDGLDQPALALCSPDVAQDNEDGLLTMGEILKLKMNADWVVLSACNSGAAGGKGTEAISGLGRAFFYAGSRALLVTMWPVETTSAKKLTTGLFRFQKNDPDLSKARALQKSMLDLMERGVLKDDKSGKLVTSYAHPFFWAPFIIVGDGS